MPPTTATRSTTSLSKRESTPTRFGIFDIGTNSVRLDVYEITAEQSFKRIHRERLMVRLGEGLFARKNVLAPKVISRVLDACNYFAQIMSLLRTQYCFAFATSALREARNAKTLIKQVASQTGIHIKVISGLEESRLIARGVLANENLPAGRFAVVDIGGGSTEIILVDNNNICWSKSFPLGAARLTQLFQGKPAYEASAYAQNILKTAPKDFKPTVLLGSSGSIRSIVKLYRKIHGSQRITPALLSQFIQEITEMTHDEVLALPGIEWKRAEILVAGGILLNEVAATLGVGQIRGTEYALRDGVLNLIQTDGVKALRSLHAKKLSEREPINYSHDAIERATTTTVKLFAVEHKLQSSVSSLAVSLTKALVEAWRMGAPHLPELLYVLATSFHAHKLKKQDQLLLKMACLAIVNGKNNSKKELRTLSKENRRKVLWLAFLSRASVILLRGLEESLVSSVRIKRRESTTFVYVKGSELLSLQYEQLTDMFEGLTGKLLQSRALT
jgi:exopolyphosphatase/guanosine-5'-triphosphate,3'-diphosphate pyrophosphatase